MLIHAGDFVSLEFFERLKRLCKDIKAVCGNMDPQEIRDLLPPKVVFKAGRYKIGIFHGCGAPHGIFDLLNAEFRNDKLDIIVFGHTHGAYNEKRGEILYFNPGSPTDKACVDCNTYGIIEINDRIEARILKI